MTAISVSERLLEMAAFYTPLALTVTIQSRPPGYNKRVLVLSGKRIPATIRSRDKKSVYAIHDIILSFSRVTFNPPLHLTLTNQL